MSTTIPSGRSSVRQEMQAELDRVSLGWLGEALGARLVVAPGPCPSGGWVRCELRITAPDVLEDGAVLRTCSTDFLVRPGERAEVWWPTVEWALFQRLVHEVREGLAVDGRVVDNPHASSAWPCAVLRVRASGPKATVMHGCSADGTTFVIDLDEGRHAVWAFSSPTDGREAAVRAHRAATRRAARALRRVGPEGEA